MRHLKNFNLTLLLFAGIQLTAQGQWNTNGNTVTGTEFLGTTGGSTQPLRLRTATSDAIIFQTNGANERMRVDASGNLGIGTTSPSHLLELGTGDFNLTDGIIRIGGDEMVYYNTTQNNLGYGTVHDFNAITSGGDNIFVGFNAGIGCAEGSNNIFIGDESGDAVDDGERNLFMGSESGSTQTSASDNVYLGHHSGRVNLQDENVFVGSGTSEVATDVSSVARL